jgi:subtilisin family serine protease
MEPSAYMPKAVITENTPVAELKRANQPFTFGCGKNEYPLSNLRLGTDFISMGGTPVSWNLISPGLVQTWARNIAGQGIKIAYFDTGCSYLQDRMHHGFAIGMSAARTLEKISTLPRFDYQGLTTPHDDCGHGTASTSVGTAPRSGGTSVGIAYQSDLLSVKTAYDPIINTPQELRGVADGFTQVGNRADVKIISMSLGTTIVPLFGGGGYVLTSLIVGDAVRQAYQRGKLILCAAGTDPVLPSWLHNFTVFPASMSEVTAVTGIKERYYSNGTAILTSGYTSGTPCDECFYSQKVDFSVVTQKNYGTAKRVLCLPRTNQYDANTFGGSSSATASFAGMVAVVWSKYPSFSRAQIIEKLKDHASCGSSRNSTIGWGVVNVDNATR